jgi:hypothetical protein
MLETPKAFFPNDGKVERIFKMDNQQERLLHWLGGFIDGEGCFGIYRKNEAGKIFHYPILDIVNTNPLDIDRAADIIKRHTGCHIDCKADGINRPKWSLRVLGFKRMRQLLPVIIPYLHGKQEEAQLLLEFCSSEPDESLREDMKAQLSVLKNPQRLYAKRFLHLRIDDKVQQLMKIN